MDYKVEVYHNGKLVDICHLRGIKQEEVRDEFLANCSNPEKFTVKDSGYTLSVWEYKEKIVLFS